MTSRSTYLLLIAMASIGGCQHHVENPQTPDDLRSLVGHQVHLEGRFGGPGKLADYIIVAGDPIYLLEPIDAGGQKLEYGSTVTVDGLLGYQSYPPSTQPAGEQAVVARAPDHYFINNAKVRVRRPAMGAS